MKRLLSLLVILTLLTSTIAGIAYAQEPWEDNEIHFETQNFFSYQPTGDLFFNEEVTGSMFWQAGCENRLWNSGRVIENLDTILSNSVDIDWYELYLEESPTVTVVNTSETPQYQWLIGNIEPYQGVGFMVFPTDPDDAPIAYEPGFDSVRSVDRTSFLSGDGTQTQILTVSVTPREGYLQNHNNNNIIVYIAAGQNQLVPNSGNDNLEASIKSISYASSFIAPTGQLGAVILDNWEVGKPITAQIEIEVAPSEPEVEYMPTVWVFEVVEEIDDLYGEEYQHEFGEPYQGLTHSLVQPQLGEWTWEIDMEDDDETPWIGWRENVLLKGITFSRETPLIGAFNVCSMFINFGEGPDSDEISIPEATFELADGAQPNLMNNDVTVIVDGVEIIIPAGSFKSVGGPSAAKYTYNSKGNELSRINMEIDFGKGELSFEVHDINAELIDNGDGVSVVFAIGDGAAIDLVNMNIGSLCYIESD